MKEWPLTRSFYLWTLFVAVATDYTSFQHFQRDVLVLSAGETARMEITWIGPQHVMVTYRSVPGTDCAIVAVSSMESVDRYERYNRVRIPVLATILVVVVVTLMHFM